jgi:hypothetical protein
MPGERARQRPPSAPQSPENAAMDSHRRGWVTYRIAPNGPDCGGSNSRSSPVRITPVDQCGPGLRLGAASRHQASQPMPSSMALYPSRPAETADSRRARLRRLPQEPRAAGAPERGCAPRSGWPEGHHPGQARAHLWRRLQRRRWRRDPSWQQQPPSVTQTSPVAQSLSASHSSFVGHAKGWTQSRAPATVRAQKPPSIVPHHSTHKWRPHVSLSMINAFSGQRGSCSTATTGADRSACASPARVAAPPPLRSRRRREAATLKTRVNSSK